MNKPVRYSRRLSTKFISGVVLILLVVLLMTQWVNSQVAGRYYLRQQREYVRQVGLMLEEQIRQGNLPEDAVNSLEEDEQVLITYSANTEDYDSLSNDLRDKFREKGLGFKTFWLWDQDYLAAARDGSKFRFYQQSKLNYGILVEYLPIDENLYAIAFIVPDAAGVIEIVNWFGVLLYSLAMLTAVGLIWLLVRHITNPLSRMAQFAGKVAAREYDSLVIKTGDELEIVAESMNQMSREIQQYQEMLLDQNRQMEQLLDNVAHDLKTPISLIGVYASGIQDQLDDGTFLETIIRQNDRMAELTNQLLALSRIGREDYPVTEIALDQLLTREIEEQQILVRERDIKICTSIISDAVVSGNTELISGIFSNLISNAFKYASDGEIHINLQKTEAGYQFSITNAFHNDSLEPERIWEPFYVGEASRNKALSGTGLGLSMVKKMAEQSGARICCSIDDNNIKFEVDFVK